MPLHDNDTYEDSQTDRIVFKRELGVDIVLLCAHKRILLYRSAIPYSVFQLAANDSVCSANRFFCATTVK